MKVPVVVLDYRYRQTYVTGSAFAQRNSRWVFPNVDNGYVLEYTTLTHSQRIFSISVCRIVEVPVVTRKTLKKAYKRNLQKPLKLLL